MTEAQHRGAPIPEQADAVEEEAGEEAGRQRCHICHCTGHGVGGATDALLAVCGTPGCGSSHISCFFHWQLRRAELRQDPYTCAVCLQPAVLPSGPVTQLVAEGGLDRGGWQRLERMRAAGHGGRQDEPWEELEDPLLAGWLRVLGHLEQGLLLEGAERAAELAAAAAEAAARAGAGGGGVGQEEGEAGGAVVLGDAVVVGEAVLLGRQRPRPRRAAGSWLGGALLALAAAATALALAGATWGGGGRGRTNHSYGGRGTTIQDLLQRLAADPWADDFAWFNT